VFYENNHFVLYQKTDHVVYMDVEGLISDQLIIYKVNICNLEKNEGLILKIWIWSRYPRTNPDRKENDISRDAKEISRVNLHFFIGQKTSVQLSFKKLIFN